MKQIMKTIIIKLTAIKEADYKQILQKSTQRHAEVSRLVDYITC
jgi:hypothetical protein